MLYKPPGAVYIASYKEPLDQSDHVLEPLYIKKEGASWKFWKEPSRDTKILFCGRDLKCEMFFLTLRGTNSKAAR